VIGMSITANSIWYDAGNIIHYTGSTRSPIIRQIAPHITGFLLGDCGEVKGDVISIRGGQWTLPSSSGPGRHRVQRASDGRIAGRDRLEETTSNARANQANFKKVLAFYAISNKPPRQRGESGERLI